MSEANKKTPRTFSCRNSLWETYQEMSDSLECSVDYLVNDAMKHYARQRGFARSSAQKMAPATSTPLAAAGAAPPPSPLSSGNIARPAAPPQAQPQQAAPPQAQPRAAAPRPTAPPLQRPSVAAPPVRSAPAPPAAPRRTPAPNRQHSSAQVTNAIPQAQLAPQRSAAPAPPPPAAQVVPSAAAHGATAQPAPHLVLYHQGQAFPVGKERYVIGRGKSSSDMTIRDPNISRQHAIVELLQGIYYMVDLGSTNGIEFDGQRVQRKAIHHGDVFQICNHDVICHLS